MAHRLLAEHPQMKSYIYLNAYAIPKLLYPLYSAPPAPPGRDQLEMAPEWRFYNQICDDYRHASDEDLVFTCNGAVCEETVADHFFLRTSLKAPDGSPVVLQSALNSNPKCKWLAQAFLAGFPTFGSQEKAPVPAPADAEPEPVATEPASVSDIPLLTRYPTFDKLVHVPWQKLTERLVPLTGNPDHGRVDKVLPQLNHMYQSRGEAICHFTLNSEITSPDDADRLVFETEYKSVAGKPILLQCSRNRTSGMEPWFGEFFTTEDWRASLRSFDLLRLVSILPTHVDNNLRRLVYPPAALPTDCSACLGQMARRYEEAAPEEIQYYRGSLQVASLDDDPDEMVIPTGYLGENKEEIMLLCVLNTNSHYKQRWISRRFFLPSQTPFHGRAAGKWLFNWAKFGSPGGFSSVLAKLASMATDEVWDSGKGKYAILHNYLVYTFVRLYREDKIVESSNHLYAAFNTGLVDYTYGYIYALFCRSETAELDGIPWQFMDFCLPNEGPYGKTLSEHFRYHLPLPAQYFHNNTPPYYSLDPTRDAKFQVPGCSYEHILAERCHRLPLSFLRKYSALREILEQNGIGPDAQAPSDPHSPVWRAVRKYLKQPGNDAYAAMSMDFDKALELAVRRAALNYRTAVPYYDPLRDKLCLLLPLTLTTRSSSPDVVLVLEPHTENDEVYYAGQTIITLSMAYQNARLVCRPESEWLSAGSAGGAVEDEEDEEDESEN